MEDNGPRNPRWAHSRMSSSSEASVDCDMSNLESESESDDKISESESDDKISESDQGQNNAQGENSGTRELRARPKVYFMKKAEKVTNTVEVMVEPEVIVSKVCLGCSWKGKSLRAHLRAKELCQKFYDMEALEKEALRVKKQQQAIWESNNRKKRTKRMKKKPPISPRQNSDSHKTPLDSKQSMTSDQQLKNCSGCKWQGKSLRGHLRGNTQCREFYNLDELERVANETKRLQKVEWEKKHKKERTGRKKGKVKVSPKPGCHSCSICNKTFTFKYMLNRHVKDVHKLKVYSCYKCPKHFSRKENLNRHLLKCGSNDPNKTPKSVLGYGYGVFKSDYERFPIPHANKKVSVPTKQHKSCKVCGWQGKSLGGHLRYKPDCKNSYDIKELKRDAIASKKAKEAAWELANRKKRSERMIHRKACVNENPDYHTCNICDRVLTSVSNLNRHVKDVHGESKPYSCPKCPEDFSRKKNLQRHLERDKHSIVYYCHSCLKKITFKTEREKQKHFIKHRKGEIPNRNLERNQNHSSAGSAIDSKMEPTTSTSSKHMGKETNPKPHECKQCGKKFQEKFNLKRHVDDVHKKLKRFKCGQCKEEFSRFHSLQRHKFMVDHLLPFKCPSCKEVKSFKTKREAEKYFYRCSTKKEDKERRKQRCNEIELAKQKLEDFKENGQMWHQLTEDQKKEYDEKWDKEQKMTILKGPSRIHGILKDPWDYRDAVLRVRDQVVMNQWDETIKFKKSDEWKAMPQELKDELEKMWWHFKGERNLPSLSFTKYCHDCVAGSPWWKEVLEMRRKERQVSKSGQKNMGCRSTFVGLRENKTL